MAEDWTFETLKEHFDALRLADKEAVGTALAAAEKAVTAALTASEKAILKAENASDKRAEASNEIRGAMIDQQKHFVTIAQYDALRERTDKVEAALLTSGGRAAGFGQIGTIAVTAIVAASATVAIFATINGAG